MLNHNLTLVDILERWVESQPSQTAYVFVASEDEEESISYATLATRAKTLAAHIQTKAKVGDRALLVYPPGLDFIIAFFACAYAGVIAVPVYPAINESTELKNQKIIEDCEPSLILPDQIEEDWDDAPVSFQKPLLSQEDLVFLQYTSGSTGHPKGVMVSHGNLLHNLELIQTAFEADPTHTVVSWLPQYHDMGLIGCILGPIYTGCLCVLMSPFSFLQKPYLWLKTISRYPNVKSGGPNFAYDYCVRKITSEQKKTLDLSSWQVAFNGAEPIHPKTLENFTAAFQECGFQKQALFPCYGLAESTLMVSGGLSDTGYKTKNILEKTLVSCGRLSQHVRIVDPSTCMPVSSQEEGEIWVHSPSVTKGYWHKPEITQEIFHARLHESMRQDPDFEKSFLRTGDLGFLHEGELYVTGRIKDLIIIRGKNYYPQDVEETVVHAHERIRLGGVVAFSINSAREDAHLQEELVIVAEINIKDVEESALSALIEDMAQTIHKSVVDKHGLFVKTVAFIPPYKLPKTTSGKVQRQLTKSLLQTGQLTLHGMWNRGRAPHVST